MVGRIVIASVLDVLFLAWSLATFRRLRSAGAICQLVGALAMSVVVLTHIAETTGFASSMGWGRPDSVGHYLDLSSAIIAVTLVPLGLGLRMRDRRSLQHDQP